MNKREHIEGTIKDLVSRMLYHDRKEDETLQRGDIDKAVRDGVITIPEMVAIFQSELEENIHYE